jgi:hypothetical protein
MMTAQHYRLQCPACDKWHDSAEQCDEPMATAAERYQQRVIKAVERYETKRAKRKGKRNDG